MWVGGSCASFSSWKAAAQLASNRQGSSQGGGGGAWRENLKYETGYVLKPRKTVNWGVTKGLISALPGFSAGLGQSVKCFNRLEVGTAGHSCPCGRGPGLSLAPAEGKERSCARVTVPFRKAACAACDRPWEHAAGGVAAWQDRAGIACARPSSPRSPLHRRAPGWARKCKSFKALAPTCCGFCNGSEDWARAQTCALMRCGCAPCRTRPRKKIYQLQMLWL